MRTTSQGRAGRWLKVVAGVGIAFALTVPPAAAAPTLTGGAVPAEVAPQAFDIGDSGTIQVPTSTSCPTLTSPPRAYEAWFNIEDMEVRGYYDPANQEPWDYVKKVAQVICGAATNSKIKLSMYFMRAIGTLRNPGLNPNPDNATDPAAMGSRPESDPEMIYDALEYVIKNRNAQVGFILDGGGITPQSAKRLIVKRMATIAGARGAVTAPNSAGNTFRSSAVEWCMRGCFNTGSSYQSRYAINHEKFLTISDTIWDRTPSIQGDVAPETAPPPATAAPVDDPQATAPEDAPSPSETPSDTPTAEPSDTPTAEPSETTTPTLEPVTPTAEPSDEVAADAGTSPAPDAGAALFGYGGGNAVNAGPAVAPAAAPGALPAADGAPLERTDSSAMPVVISTSGNFARSQTRNYVQEMTVVYDDYRLWQEFSKRYDAMAACSIVFTSLNQSTSGQVANCRNTSFPTPLNSQLKKDSLGIWVDSTVRSGDSGRGTQVIFSPQPASVKDAYVKVFDRVDCTVDKQIRVAMFKLTDSKAVSMIKALSSLKSRGCDVKVLLTQQGGATTISRTVVSLLRRSRLNVKCTQTPMHTKVILIGPANNNNGRVLSGTANMSTSGLRYSEEHTLIFDARTASPQYQDDIRRVYGVYRSAWYELSKISKSCRA